MRSDSTAASPFPASLLWIPAVAILAYGFYYFVTFTLDDPFISFRYAENLVRGRGLVFNPGEHVEGYSNLLWVLLMALPVALGFGSSHTQALILIAKLLGTALGFACVPLMLHLGRRLQPEDGRGAHSGLHAVPALVLGVGVSFPMWAVSGLETSLFAFLLLLCGVLYLRAFDGSRRDFFASAFAVWMLGATRPEGFFAAGALALHLVVWGRRSRIRGRDRLVWLALFAIGVAGLELFRIAYYGAWLPNTFFAKVGVPRTWMFLRGLQQAVEGVLSTIGLPLAFLIPMAWNRRGVPQAWWLALLVSAFGVVFVIAVGGDWMPGQRLLVPFLPWLAVLLETSLRALLRAAPGPGDADPAPRAPARRRALRGALATLAIGIGALVVMRGRILALNDIYHFQPLHRGGSLVQPAYVETAHWLRGNLPADAWVAVGEAGVIPFFAPQRFVDLLALNDPVLARLPARFSTDYVLQRAPEYVLLAGLSHGAQGLECRYSYGQDLLADVRFAPRYQPCRSFGSPPEQFTGAGQNFVLYARRDCGCPPDSARASVP